jgi:hypothetical protein
VKEHRIKLRMRYHQTFKRPRCRKEEGVFLTEDVSILIREIDASDAPVAYCVYTQDEYSSDRLHEVRSFESAFWWPLMASDGPVSVARFIEHAADGKLGSFMTFGSSIKLGREDGRSFTEFFNEFPTYRFGEFDRDDQFLRTSRGAARVVFCDGHVFVNAGAPIWYVAVSTVRDRLDAWLGHDALDRVKTRVWTAGPDGHMQRYCCEHGRAYGLAEIDSEIKRLTGAQTQVCFRSRIEILMDLHLPEGAALLCARTLIESIWRSAVHSETMRAAVPLLGAAAAMKAVPKDLNFFRVLSQFSTFEDRTMTRTYWPSIVAARELVRRLEAFGCTPLASEDDEALGALGF